MGQVVKPLDVFMELCYFQDLYLLERNVLQQTFLLSSYIRFVNLVDVCTRFGFPWALLSLDQEKAFNSVIATSRVLLFLPWASPVHSL